MPPNLKSVSVPEKTLEHWTSQYILFRFRTNAQVWWPPYGADIEVRSLPRRPGKAFFLELKTARTIESGHELSIDLRQLAAYLSHPVARQPFYVLPVPKWHGEIEAAAAAVWRGLRSAPDFAFLRSGYRWFGNWTYVLTARQVGQCLTSQLAQQAKSNKRLRAPLLRVDFATGVTQWLGSGMVPAAIPWRTFWDRMSTCGEPAWPQTILVAREEAPKGLRADYRQLISALSRSRPPRQGRPALPPRSTTSNRPLRRTRIDRVPLRQTIRPIPPELDNQDVLCFEAVDDGLFQRRDLDEPVAPLPPDQGTRASTFLGIDELWLPQT